MTHDAIPQPLLGVLQSVLHANLFATWRSDLTSWDVNHPHEAPALRRQLAQFALTAAIAPQYFKRLTGHDASDAGSVREWFAQVYHDFYGSQPKIDDTGR